MKKIILLLVFLTGSMRFSGQVPDTLTLDNCYWLAGKNYPLSRQTGLVEQTSALRVKNINKSWLPQVSINGNASFQNEVTQLAIPLPAGMSPLESPELSKDWYKLTLDVNQAIYDGNTSSYSKKLEVINLKNDKKSIEIELYRVKERINQVYFSILLLLQNEELLLSTKEQLETKLKEVRSGIAHGAVLEVNADLIRAELIRLDQQLTEVRADRSAAVKMLSELISTPIPDQTVMKLPGVTAGTFLYEDKRPEYELFSIQRSRVMVMKNMVTTRWNPRLFAYGQAGIGRPGFNFLSNDFSGLWIIGAKLTWTPWNWNLNKNEKQIYLIQGDILQTQQETFDKNLRVTVQKDLADISKYADLMLQDQEIIDLRTKITKVASSQLDNGVITSSDYISRLNEETQSRLNREIHRIQLTRAKLSYLYNTGKL